MRQNKIQSATQKGEEAMTQTTDKAADRAPAQTAGQSLSDRLKALPRSLCWLVYGLIDLAAAFLILQATVSSGILFEGTDTMYHVYRGQWLLDQWQQGTIWPLLDPAWYNGVELLRYWAPSAAMLMAGCIAVGAHFPQFLESQAVFAGYDLYCCLIFLIAALSWQWAGWKYKRPVLGGFLGLLWFFVPQNLFVLYFMGNLPRALAMAIFPVVLVHFYGWLHQGRTASLVWFMVSFLLIITCHIGFAGMVALGLVILLVCERFIGHRRGRGLTATGALILCFLVAGLLVVPAMTGSGTSAYNTLAVTQGFFQSLFTSLNPFLRFKTLSLSYYGLSVFLLAVFILLCGRRRLAPLSVAALIILILTTNTAEKVVTGLPGGSMLWMLRFLSISIAFVLFAFLRWHSLKKPIALVVCLVLVLDAAPSLGLLQAGQSAASKFDAVEEASLLDEAKGLTESRLAILDGVHTLANGVYIASGYKDSVNILYGQGREAATIAQELVKINDSFDYGSYRYMFDRLSALGADTVLVKKDSPAVTPWSSRSGDAAATERGYEKVDENTNYALYHLNGVTGPYGVVSRYDSIAIGDGSYYIAQLFPSVEERPDVYLDDLTADDLDGYSRIYLSAFQYHDVDAAEALVRELAARGKEVYVLADGLPTNPHTQSQTFLGVDAQPIAFQNGYPHIYWQDQEVATSLYPDALRDWRTIYLNGLDHVTAYGLVLDNQLACAGDKEGIHFIGFNLTYYLSQTHDLGAAALLEGITSARMSDLPQRTYLPIQVDYGRRSITITAPQVCNSTLAAHDIFRGDFTVKNDLVQVKEGTTVISLHYPKLAHGAGLSLAGLILAILFLRHIRRVQIRQAEKTQEEANKQS
jgi:uncharacterized membrane protein